MNCFRVQNLLSAYIDQELDAEDRRMLRTHLFNCPECSREFASLTAVKNMMGRLSAPTPPGNSLFLVHQEISEVDTEWSHPHPYFNGRHMIMTAACVSLFMMTSLLIFPNRAQGNPDTAIADRVKISPNIVTSPVNTTSYDQKKKPELPEELFRRNQSSSVLTGIPVSR